MDAPFVLGMDIGGSKVAIAAVTPEGQILARAGMPTQAERGFDDGVRRILSLADQVMAQAQRPRRALRAIGMGCPGPLDPAQGIIDNPYTLPTWEKVDILRPLRSHLGVPAALENDADAAAMGEIWLGAGQGARSVAMVTVGTGIGGAWIIDGQIYRGAGGAHPEIGHQCIDPSGPPCYCGIRGCWESLASGSAIAASARDRMPDRAQDLDGAAAVIALARAGHPVAQEVIARAAHALALGIFTLVNLYVPDVVVLGGGVMDAYDLFEPAIRQVIERDTMAPIDRIAIRKAGLGNDAGILGAARIALSLVDH